MILEYYPETDMLYIQLRDESSSESEEIAPGIVLDFDKQHRIVGIEIEDASKFMDLSKLELKALPIVDLILKKRTPVEV